MGRTLSDMIAELPQSEQREIELRAMQLIDEEMTLRDLRKAHQLTQTRLAEALSISQDGVSRIEKRSDFLLSTLRSYIEGMGGTLRLVAEFPERRPVTIAGLGSLDGEVKSTRKLTRRDPS